VTHNSTLSALTAAAMVFGGLMFGPDLDTMSRQYTRWGPFRVFWYPYRVLFRHRSRLSHGLTLGTLIRVLYFSGVVALLVFSGIYLRAALVGGGPPAFAEVVRAWREVSNYVVLHTGEDAVLATFAGLWLGAASHTLADVGWSILRKGSQIF
jgi:uncharacterized metal-binding protein